MTNTTEKKEYAPLKLHWKVLFGKYANITVKHLIDTDQNYFDWMVNKTTVKFDSDVLLYRRSSKKDRENFIEIQEEQAKSRAVILLQWQTIKPKYRNLEVKASDFRVADEYMNEEISELYIKPLNFTAS